MKIHLSYTCFIVAEITKCANIYKAYHCAVVVVMRDEFPI